MTIFDWFAEARSRKKEKLAPPAYQEREIPDGLWHKCPNCNHLTYIKDLQNNLLVCPHCHFHNQVPAPDRIAQLLDPDSWREINGHLVSTDPLNFCDRKPYPDRLEEYRSKTELQDAVVTGLGKMEGIPVALGVMDFRFMGGSMGSVVGEKIARLTETATDSALPLLLVCASGGARMQEGILSLMQMAKTAAALDRHRRARQLYIAILTNPTTGGVTASFAMLGDIIIAEPKALIGFTGRRVIEQTLKQKIPDNFQTSEYLLEHGFVDMVVPRLKLRSTLVQLLRLHNYCPALSK
ncbi:MAG: acetyl-CoA carboxylase, carboxyltransferase subunit beta [Pseudanabaenaceae cyanobacterium SKYGB_i_bin29]|nr:acetyl-CoA carboxylase, carboxyltransferase subunit beta [Pseudanabaenaceae cyanobacterium SKYG29]MDW8421329.1 acetyl-CoA carboxylase, carboxyltransferase subunit beta [Pseudanabaenaceae cyanobacterium SKYGB_i_bin29]